MSAPQGRALPSWAAFGVTASLLAPGMGLAQTSEQNDIAGTAQVVTVPQPASVQLDTSDLAIPTAQEVIVDLPSAFYAPRYQSGEINGLRYVLFPDGSGKVMQARKQREVLFRLNCSANIACTISGADGSDTVVPAINAPKPILPTDPDGMALSRYLAQWLVAETGVAPTPVAAPILAEASVQEVAKPVQEIEAPVQKADAPALKEKKVVLAELKPQPKQQPWTQIQPTRKTKPRVVRHTPKKQAPAKVAARATPPVVREEPVVSKLDTTQSASERKTLFQRINLACSVTGSVTLRYKNHSSGSERFGKPRASFGCGAKLTDKLSLRLSVIGYADKNEKSPSDAEFTYALSYRATDKLTLSYSNYSARYSDSSAAFVDSLTDGALRASYKLPKIKLPNSKTIGCSASIGLPKPKDTTANLSCSYAVTDRLRISGTAYAYFSGNQEPWDPDFAYSASYRINDDWSVSYSNYANNRFFWNKSSGPGEGILGGTVSISYKFKF